MANKKHQKDIFGDMQNKINKIKNLINELNQASWAYYNTDSPIMTDSEFDKKLNILQNLEEETNIVYSNSPTQNVGASILASLKKFNLSQYPMLSLAKVHSANEIFDFLKDKDSCISVKCDGLSMRLIYKNGYLTKASTRGNGIEGTDITEHAYYFTNIPLRINKKETYIVDGEAIIKLNDFKEINENQELKNPRNAASGTLNTLDLSIVKQRKMSFILWDIIEGYSFPLLYDNFKEAQSLGFEVVPHIMLYGKTNIQEINDINDIIINKAKNAYIPYDGVVWKINDLIYGESLGQTSHHKNNAIAWKPYDETYETTLRDIEWSMGRTGTLTPIAIFDEVDTGDSIVTRANLHNISIMNELYPYQWCTGMKLEIYLANMIIPQVKSVTVPEAPAYRLDPPKICPICGGNTEIRQINDSKELVCTNPECNGILINRLDHFASKRGLDIKGLSKATLEKLIDWNWVNKLQDIYTLSLHSEDWYKKPGFGKKSVDNILAAIETSRNCSLDKFISAIGIPLIGNNIAKDIANHVYDYCEFRDMATDKYPFFNWDGFGDERAAAIWNFNFAEADEVFRFLHIPEKQIESEDKTLKGKSFVITGSLKTYKNRDELKAFIESKGGKVVGSISSKTNYLINNDINSTSSKNKKAKELDIPIITEDEFNAMI